MARLSLVCVNSELLLVLGKSLSTESLDASQHFTQRGVFRCLVFDEDFILVGKDSASARLGDAAGHFGFGKRVDENALQRRIRTIEEFEEGIRAHTSAMTTPRELKADQKMERRNGSQHAREDAIVFAHHIHLFVHIAQRSELRIGGFDVIMHAESGATNLGRRDEHSTLQIAFVELVHKLLSGFRQGFTVEDDGVVQTELLGEPHLVFNEGNAEDVFGERLRAQVFENNTTKVYHLCFGQIHELDNCLAARCGQ